LICFFQFQNCLYSFQTRLRLWQALRFCFLGRRPLSCSISRAPVSLGPLYCLLLNEGFPPPFFAKEMSPLMVSYPFGTADMSARFRRQFQAISLFSPHRHLRNLPEQNVSTSFELFSPCSFIRATCTRNSPFSQSFSASIRPFLISISFLAFFTLPPSLIFVTLFVHTEFGAHPPPNPLPPH